MHHRAAAHATNFGGLSCAASATPSAAGSDGGGSLRADAAHAYEDVPLRTLDELLLKSNRTAGGAQCVLASPLARLDLLKIDVEAMELQLLYGAARTIEHFRPVMYVENDRPQSSQALLRHLAKLRYRLFWSVEPYFDPDVANFNGVPPARNPFGNRVAYNVLALPAERASHYNVAMPEIHVEVEVGTGTGARGA